ncbi:transcription/translation regulatory transformer protein RfaH [Vibrio sp. CAU 1672]|uniref:transcription/translation regulatory transformer protein RfaH n=1 Tax=Vibrio sp. CAU 1672 TaxID=3032594 RepID=UPI0023DC4844|nr:transcription/translation regulatory transformer protein RfaH [Vibrio sp. CAU 1672]MDF2155245.1 transcription/translation regulatory transformer protein RfaH [Vibrio sp. CAU 1672]
MKRWYLLYCKRGEQARAVAHLSNQSVECFYPTIDVEKISRGKRTKVKEPLFPSYVFARFDYEQGPSFTSVRSTRGVIDFVRFGALPKEVDEGLVTELLQLEASSEDAAVESMPKCGDVVRVKSGQFAGIDAIFQEQDGEKRSIMLVKMISQSVPVSIDNRNLDLN